LESIKKAENSYPQLHDKKKLGAETLNRAVVKFRKVNTYLVIFDQS